MLEWANAGERAHLAVLIYHDDAEREYAYGPAGGLPDTHVGTLTDALMTEAKDDGWAVVSMKNDWNHDLPLIGMTGAEHRLQRAGEGRPDSNCHRWWGTRRGAPASLNGMLVHTR